MFTENFEASGWDTRHEISSQIANSSVDGEYVIDELKSWPQISLSSQRGEDELQGERIPYGEVFMGNSVFVWLTSIIEAGFRKLNHNIDMLLSAQKISAALSNVEDF